MELPPLGEGQGCGGGGGVSTPHRDVQPRAAESEQEPAYHLAVEGGDPWGLICLGDSDAPSQGQTLLLYDTTLGSSQSGL